jgi:hypothetical protein
MPESLNKGENKDEQVNKKNQEFYEKICEEIRGFSVNYDKNKEGDHHPSNTELVYESGDNKRKIYKLNDKEYFIVYQYIQGGGTNTSHYWKTETAKFRIGENNELERIEF